MFALDKITHFSVGANISFLASMAGPGCGTAAAVLAGRGKEVWDNRQNRAAAARGERAPHSVERADQVATFLGGLAADVFVQFALPHRVNVLASIFTMM